MAIDPLLQGIAVLVVDEQPFRGGYVSDVLSAAGAIVHGLFADPSAALTALADTASPPALAYIGVRAAADDAFVAQLAARGVAYVALGRDTGDRPAATGRGVLLRPPLAAFQIVEALAGLRRRCTA